MLIFTKVWLLNYSSIAN